MKILIAVPTFETITPETFRSIYRQEKNGHEVDFDFVKGYDCAKARNDIGKKTIDGGYDAVLMVDSDIILPENALANLAEGSTDLVLGCYPKKNTTDGAVELFKFSPNFDKFYNYKELPNGARMPVKGGGFGCAMVRADCFRKLKFPWFKYVVYDSGMLLSEDLYFCHNLKAAKMTIEADTRVRCGHLVRRFQYE